MDKNGNSQGMTLEERVKDLEGQLSESTKQVEALKKELSTANKAGEKLQKAYDTISEGYNTLFKEKGEIEDENSEERLYKNEAYAFILSEGLLDKFLDFREPLHRTRSQEIHYTLTTASDLPGEWIAE